LRAYRLFSMAARPLAPLALAERVRRGKEDRTRLAERRGDAGTGRPPGPLVWIHGASVGELMSVLPLIERIRAREVTVLVTSGTVTSSELAAQRLPPGVIHQFAPLDIPAYVRRFFDHWQPDLALFVESDLWPNRIIEASRRRVPMILVNGRLSENSYRRWRYLPAAITDLLLRFDLCLARTPTDAERLNALGAPRIITTGNLKLDVPAPPYHEDQLASLKRAIGDRPVMAAASTHEGEEAAMIEVHQRLAPNFPGLLTVIAPRHPERGLAIAGQIAAAGMRVKLRSRGELPDAATGIYVADTLGELGLIYRLAPVVLIGGSLVRHGGQNPIEAAKLGAAIVHGPHVWNFAEVYAALDEGRGAEIVADESRLTGVLGMLLAHPAARERVATNAYNTVQGLGGALERTMSSLEPYLLQLRLGQ
jgi:3-deoxy-D-manno-octulosonic-acid transferase